MTMEKYSEIVGAGGMLEIEHPGSFFTLLRSAVPLDVEFVTDFRVSDSAKSMVPGLWFEPEKRFDKVRLWNRTGRDVKAEFLVSFGRSGWMPPPPSIEIVELDAANLPASISVASPWLYLGEHFSDVLLTATFAGVASTGGQFGIQCSIDGNASNARNAVGAGFNGVANVSIAGFVGIGTSRPLFPYVRLVVINGTTVQSAGAKGNMIVMRNASA